MAFEMAYVTRKMALSKLILLLITLFVVFDCRTVVCQNISTSLSNTVSPSSVVTGRSSSNSSSEQSTVKHSLSSYWSFSTSSLLLESTTSKYSTSEAMTSGSETISSLEAISSLKSTTSLEATTSLKTMTPMGGFASDSSIPNSYTTVLFALSESSRTTNEPTTVAAMSTSHPPSTATNVMSSNTFVRTSDHSSGITIGVYSSAANIAQPSTTTIRMIMASISINSSPVSSTDYIESSTISPTSQQLKPSESSNLTVQLVSTAARSDSATIPSFYSFVVTSVNRSSVTETGSTGLGIASNSINFSAPSSHDDTSTIKTTRHETTQSQSALETTSLVSISSFTTTQTILPYATSSNTQISSSLILPFSTSASLSYESNTSMSLLPRDRASESPLSSSEAPNNASTASISTESHPIHSTVNSTDYILPSATFSPKTRSSEISQSSSPTLNSSVVPTTPDPNDPPRNDQEMMIAIVAGSASGVLFLLVLIGCICMYRKSMRDERTRSARLEGGNEDSSNDLRKHWDTLRGRPNFRKSVMDLPEDMYSETNGGFELDSMISSQATLMSVGPSDETAEEETREDDSGTVGTSCGTFKRDAGKSNQSSESLLALINENDDTEPTVPNAGSKEMKSFKRDVESTEKPVERLNQSSLHEEPTADASSKEEEELPDPTTIPPPIVDGEEAGASATEDAVVAPKKGHETRDDNENSSIQQEDKESESKRLSEYYC